MFGHLDSVAPINTENDTGFGTPEYQPRNFEQSEQFVDQSWSEQFAGYKTRPVLYNIEGYIYPYASNNWGGGCNILSAIDDESRLPRLDNKIDPNKIFTSDIAALKTLAADQLKITNMFKKKLMEGLTDRGKVGLNENDTMAMQALTSAVNAIASINKEQVAIKKNIADIRLKQQQMNHGSNGNSGSGDGVVATHGISNMASGRNMLDDIFSSSFAASSSVPVSIPENGDYASGTPEDAAKIVDNLIPTVDEGINREVLHATTYVVVNADGSEPVFETYNDKDELLDSDCNPTSEITDIDLDRSRARDSLLNEYILKIRE